MENIRDKFLKMHEKLHGALWYELSDVANLRRASDSTFFGVPCHVYILKNDPTCKVYFGINNQWHFNKPYMLRKSIKVMHWYQNACKIALKFDKAHQSGTFNYASAEANMQKMLTTRLDTNWKYLFDHRYINVNHVQIKYDVIYLHVLTESSYDEIFANNIIPRFIYDHVFHTPEHVFSYKWIKLSDVLKNHTRYHIHLNYDVATHRIFKECDIHHTKSTMKQPQAFIVNDTLESNLKDYIKRQLENTLALNLKEPASKIKTELPVVVKG